MQVFLSVLTMIFFWEQLRPSGLRAAPLSTNQIAPQVSIPVRLKMKPAVISNGLTITVADVVECASEVDRCSEIYAIEVGDSPKIGESKIVSRAKLRDILKEEWPTSDVTISGSDVTTVKTVGIELPPKNWTEAIHKTLAAALDRPSRRLVLLKVISPRLVHVSHLGGTMKCDLDPAFDTHLRQKMRMTKINCTYGHGDRLGEETVFRIMIGMESSVLISKKRIERSSYFGDDAVEKAWRPTKFAGSGILTELTQLHEKVASRVIREGAILTQSMIMYPDMNKRGDTVDVLVERGNLSVRVRGRMLKSGRQGDIVPIQIFRSKRTIQARVIERDKVIAL